MVADAPKTIARRVFLTAGLGAIAADVAFASGNYRLIMVEDIGCVYCARWNAEVGPGYAKSPEGQFAPLERVRIGSAELSYLKGLQFTPTFVLVEDQREIGRITGYPGADFFWGLLDQLLLKTPFRAPAVADDIKT